MTGSDQSGLPNLGDDVIGRRVLVVDDDPALREAVGRALRLEGYDVETADDGVEAIGRVASLQPHAVVLDVMMPRLDGVATVRRLREEGDRTPVLLLTARDGVSDRVTGLDQGADDYLVKPFALAELLARVRVLVRRNEPEGHGARLVVGDLSMDLPARRVERAGREIELTRTEYNLLEVLMRNAGHVQTRSVLFARVWGYDLELGSNTLDVYIGYLRRKTEAAGGPRLIHTVRGVGFVLRP